MKKSDIAMIILIASVSVLVAYFIAKGILGDVKGQTARVKVAESITTTVEAPDPTTFNSTAINPTIEVIIGGDAAQK
jgi:hypothetical protein